MNWGTRILILYLAFVGLILTLVFTCFGNKTELEYTDYYARELKFQDQIDAGNNALDLAVPIEYNLLGKTVEITIPNELLKNDLNGSVSFLRPSDSSKDKTVVLNPGPDGKQTIDENFSTGIYKMRIFVTSLGKNYYKEAVIRLK